MLVVDNPVDNPVNKNVGNFYVENADLTANLAYKISTGIS